MKLRTSSLNKFMDTTVESENLWQKVSKYSGLWVIGLSVTLSLALLVFALIILFLQWKSGDGATVVEEMVEEVVEETVDEKSEDASEKDVEALLAYNKGAYLYLLYPDHRTKRVDDVSRSFGKVGDSTISSRPVWSPNRSQLLYTSGSELRIYDLKTDKTRVIHPGDPEVEDGHLLPLEKYCWANEDKIMYVHNQITKESDSGVGTYYISSLDINTGKSKSWSSYDAFDLEMDVTTDPAEEIKRYFEDANSLSQEIYCTSETVYIQTYGKNGPVWVRVMPNEKYEEISREVVNTVTGVDFATSREGIGKYVSSEELGAYVKSVFGQDIEQVKFNYFETLLKNSGGSTIFAKDRYFVGNLRLSKDKKYLYFTEVGNSLALANAIDSRVNINSIPLYYPKSYIRRIDLESEDYKVELVTEGLGFDLR